MPVKSRYFEQSFDLKLDQLDGQDKGTQSEVIGSIFITFDTLQKICQKERTLVWGLPLAALQRKIGESGRFVLPDRSIIDDVFEYTLNDYRKYQTRTINLKEEKFPSVMVVNWVNQKATTNAVKKNTGSGTLEDETGGSEPDKAPAGPMKETDWDYVFQANKILNCSYVDPLTSQILQASHAAFRLKTVNEDDAEPDLPQDDQRAKIPVWALSREPSRTYINETHYELETSAMISGHSKRSLEVGLSGAYKAFSAEGNYGRTTESAYKSTNAYGKEENTMLTIHEIPIVDLSLDKGNIRISDACRQALLKLRDERSFDDLMEFFTKYGTMYSKKVVLGGRLVNNQRVFTEETTQRDERRKSAKNNASFSLGINVISVKGSYDDENGAETNNESRKTESQKKIDWTAVGGNAAYASKPDMWLPTVANYRYWKIVQNSEVVSIQDFIGSFPGHDDIPGLFQQILNGGLYSPESLYLGPRPALPGYKKPKLGADHLERDDGLDLAPLGLGINTPTLAPTALKDTTLSQKTLESVNSRVIARRGCSWQVLDTPNTVKLEISSTMKSLTNTSVNRSTIPEYLYSLSLEPHTISVVLQWSSDLVEKGLDLGQRSPTIVPLEVTPQALPFLSGGDKKALVESLGHQLLESYVEKASLDAVWRLRLPKGTEDDFYTLRMTLQRYFLSPRTIPEVCDFMSANMDLVPDIHVSIFGYRDEFTKKPVKLNRKLPSLARRYLTQDALLRNMHRVAITMRPWQNLKISNLPTSTVKADLPVAPEEFFILNTRKAERLLLVLYCYSYDPVSGVKQDDLPPFQKTLDKILDRTSLESDTGKMLPAQKESLIKLVQDLEAALPAIDDESPPA